VIVISFLIAFFINNKIGALYIPGDAIISTNISSYYLESSMLTFYATIMGLMFAGYTIMITMTPIFHPNSLRQPIFSEVNRLFVYTILIGLTSLLINFVSSILSSYHENALLLFIETYLFFSLILGMVFAVLALSTLFNIVRGIKLGNQPATTDTKLDKKNNLPEDRGKKPQ
jgi:hypothetical protein